LPSLENLHQHFRKDDFIFIAVDVGEKRDVVQKFIQKHGYSFLNVLDENKLVSAQYGINAHPVKFLINKSGELVGVARGYREWDSEEIKSLIRSLMDS
jgi:peroxiredoxin